MRALYFVVFIRFWRWEVGIERWRVHCDRLSEWPQFTAAITLDYLMPESHLPHGR